MNKLKYLFNQIIDSYKENPIATTVVFVLIPVLCVLSVVRIALSFIAIVSSKASKKYNKLLIKLGNNILKLRKFDKSRKGDA